MISIVMAQVGEGFHLKLIPHMRGKKVLHISRCRLHSQIAMKEWMERQLRITFMYSTKQLEQINVDKYELIIIDEVASTTLNMKRIRQLIKEAKCDIIIRPDDFLRTIRGITNYQLKLISLKI